MVGWGRWVHNPRMVCMQIIKGYHLPSLLFQKIFIPLSWKVFQIETPHPSRNSLLVSYLYSKHLAFEAPPPYPLEFPLTFHGVGMDIFWNFTIHLSVTFCEMRMLKVQSALWAIDENAIVKRLHPVSVTALQLQSNYKNGIVLTLCSNMPKPFLVLICSLFKFFGGVG